MPPIDPTKVQNKLNELNAPGQSGAPNWVVTEGLVALMSMSVAAGRITFQSDNGLPIKSFVNVRTGEVKLYDARLFVVTSN